MASASEVSERIFEFFPRHRVEEKCVAHPAKELTHADLYIFSYTPSSATSRITTALCLYGHLRVRTEELKCSESIFLAFYIIFLAFLSTTNVKNTKRALVFYFVFEISAEQNSQKVFFFTKKDLHL